jgi:hypothetical protein
MENIIFRKSMNEQGRITEIEIGGALVLENSQQLKDEFLSLTDILGGQVKITISNPEDIDLSCIQLFIAFIKFMNETHVKHQLNWTLDEDQRALLENVGLSNDLYLNNSYV